MTASAQLPIRMEIACGGTGGHLFPGLAVADELVQRGCTVTLVVSAKEVDQQVARSVFDMEVVTVPAVGLVRGGELAFVRGFLQSYRLVARRFRLRPPMAALAMGGFTSAAPVLAARRMGARTFLHESNTVPGRANRWLARVVHHAFVGFPAAAGRLPRQKATVTGTPVRACFQPRNPAICRASLGLDPSRPVLLVMGGSQGASGVNELVLDSLPLFAGRGPEWQWLHIAGSGDAEKVMRTYASMGLQAMVHAFLDRMELALGAATVAVSRAGASSLAELAAMRVPAILIPYPAATDNHQFHNARALEAAGAARLLEQKVATPEMLVRSVSDLMENRAVRAGMRDALAQWHKPGAAEQIAEAMLTAAGAGVRKTPGDCPAATTDPDRAPPGARNHPRTTGLVLDSRLEQGRPVACSTPVAAGRGP